MGVDKICRETGMTKGAFYNSFKSKEQLLLTTIVNYGNFIAKHLQNQLSGNTRKSFQGLLALYKGMLEAQIENNRMGCFVNNAMSGLGALNTAVASTTAEQFDKFLDTIEPTVREAQQNQELTDSINSKVLTKIMPTTFYGVLTTSKSTKISGYSIIERFMYTLKK